MLIHRPRDLPGVVLQAGRSAGRTSLRHMHDAYSFGLAVDGSWSAWYRGTGHTIGRGTVQLAQPGAISRCEMGPDPHAFLTISFPPPVVEDLARELWGPRAGTPTFAEHAVVDDHVAARVRWAHRRVLAGTSLLERSVTLHELCVAMLTGFARAATPPRQTAAAAGIATARQLIDDDPAADPSVAELAALAGLSPFHFSRGFREVVGLPPHAYRLHRRVERAKALLAAGRSSAEVAHSLGFADQSHLIRQFRRQTGLTPAAYARAVTT